MVCPVFAATLRGYGDIERCWLVKTSNYPDGVEWAANCGGTVVGGDFLCAQEGDGVLGDVAETLTPATEEAPASCWCRMTSPYTGMYVFIKNYSSLAMCESPWASCKTLCSYLWVYDNCEEKGYDEDCIADGYEGVFSNAEEQELFLSALFSAPETPCEIGISRLMTSTGLSFQLWAEKYTEPSLVVQYNDQKCYAKLESGSASGAINVNFNGTVYHTIVASGDSGGDDTGGDSGEEEVFNDYKFTAITTSDTTSFSFDISAAGTFYIDWGDGTTKKIEKIGTTDTTYLHNYATAGTYNIKLGGLATGYNSSTNTAAIDFYNNASLATIDGCLGCIFPTLSNGTQPSFNSTFYKTQITSIPENLFAGINGAPASYMFDSTFQYTPITSIPENLFAGIKGAPASGMFNYTFYDTPITSIPENLFAGINGAPASSMFSSTFSYTDITSIPDGLFAGVKGAPASGMFSSTFSHTPITSIPENLFSGINGAPAGSMFSGTFSYTNITSIPDGLFAGVKGAPADRMFSGTFSSTPITSIPDSLFAGINGAPADRMFEGTFYNTKITSIPDGLFAGINGAPASYMFYQTFYDTPITSIPEDLFAGINGAPASSMFYSTFESTDITSIPEDLFAGIDTTAPLQRGSFNRTFRYCHNLTGPSARINGKYLYEIWPDATSDQVGDMYSGATTKLSDYVQIPSVWK